MKNKTKDIEYCGVDAERIFSAKVKLNQNNLSHLVYFMKERFLIHIKKDIQGLPFPWTDSYTLSKYRFTNVFREDDKQTKYLIDNIVNNSNLSLEDKIVNCFMFRAWNNYDTFRDFGLPRSAQELYNPEFKEIVRPVYKKLCEKNPKRLWWSSAYNQGGTKHAWKFPDGEGYQRAYKESDAKKFSDWEKDIPLRPFHIPVWLNQQKIVKKLLKSKNQLEAFETIKSIRGFSDFLAYQVFVDLSYIPEFPFSENEFTIAGPGCKKGLNYIFDDNDNLTYEEQIFWLRNYFRKHELELCRLYQKYEKEINVMSLENCMCEISKYIRATEGTGRPRKRYKPGKEIEEQ